MWIVGHTAIAYLIIKFICICNKKEIPPRLLIFIFIYANILDSLHFGQLRFLSHNIIGAVLYSGFWILVFLKLNLIKKKEISILYLAMITHIIGDILCTSFPLPLFSIDYYIWKFNAIEHLTFSIFMTIIFLIIFISSKDFQRVSDYLGNIRKSLYNKPSQKEYSHSNKLLMLLFIFYYFLLSAQFFLFLLSYIYQILIGVVYIILFFIHFLFFFGIFSILMLKMLNVNDK